jgi:predicted TPR repeat methyltransferase
MNRKERRAARKSAMPPGGTADAHYAQAVHHFQAGQIAEAERACEAALASMPRHFGALHLLGVLAIRTGRNDVAAEAFGRAIAVNDQDPDCHFGRGRALAALHRLEEAAHHLMRAIALNPMFVNGMIGLGNVRKEQGDLEAAAALYRQALALKPDEPMAHYNLANVLVKQGHPDEAIGAYRAALAAGARSPDAFNGLAAALEGQGLVDDALATYRQALALHPHHSDLLNNLGNLYWRRGDLDQAAAHHRRALAAQPHSLPALNNLGSVLVQQGEPAQATECLEQALALKPDHPDTQVNLCAALYALSLAERERAVANARRLMAAYPDSVLLQRGLSGIVGEAVDETQNSGYARAVFDHFANSFDSTLTNLGYTPRAIVQALALDESGALLDVLDAGCGTGLCGPLCKPVARRLVGVDVSSRMLDKARARAIYDELVAADVTDFMQGHPGEFDLIVSGDVLPYLGGVASMLAAAHAGLRPNGRLAFSAESLDAEGNPEGYRLFPSGRFKHSKAYLEKALREAGFSLTTITATTIRREAGRDVAGWIVIGQKG